MTGDRVVCCLHGVGNLRKCSENDQRSRAKYSYLIMFWYNNILTKINSDQIMGRAQSTNIHILATSSVYDGNININTRTKRKVVSTVQRIPRSWLHLGVLSVWGGTRHWLTSLLAKWTGRGQGTNRNEETALQRFSCFDVMMSPCQRKNSKVCRHLENIQQISRRCDEVNRKLWHSTGAFLITVGWVRTYSRRRIFWLTKFIL